MIRLPRSGFTLAWCLLVGSAVGCGKKGPPLAPLIRLPVPAANVAVRRLGSEVQLEFTVPDANTDNSRPADLDRVEVYAVTGQPPTPTNPKKPFQDWTLVGSVKIKPPPPEETDGDSPPATPPPPSRAPEPGVNQGAATAFVDTLTPEAWIPSGTKDEDGDADERAAERLELPTALPLLGPSSETTLNRFYVAVGVNTKGQPGPPSARLAVPLFAAPVAPSAPTVSYTADQLTLAWVPPPTAKRPVQDAPLTAPAGEPPPLPPLTAKPIGQIAVSSGYNVYETRTTSPLTKTEKQSAVDLDATVVPVKPLNPTPLNTPTFEDPRVEFGVERCYLVRTVDLIETIAVESGPSPETCVKMTDTFAPTAPTALAAVATEGAISLIWEPNTEKDLGGYLILRGEAPGDKLQPITSAPIHETTFRDAKVERGRRYVYAVVAVDKATPPNVSGESNPVEETAR